MVFLPSLTFISRQDIAGNSGIEPRGAAVKIRVLFFSFFYFLIISKTGTRLAECGENLEKEQKQRGT